MMAVDNFRKTVQNPSIPYAGTIIGGLLPGELVVIRGSVPEGAERFQIDFQCGNSTKPRADVAFHFNPRFKKSGCVVCNTLQNEKWGWEEITHAMPFGKGKPFEVVFMVLQDKFQVSVNGKHLLIYKHRLNLEKIDTIGIYGNVQVGLIGFVSNTSLQGSQPSLLGATKTNAGNQEEDVPDASQFVVPYIARLHSPLEPGRTIVVKGEINEKASSFAINLKASDSNDIALHLNPRIRDKAFVRNSYLDSSWGEEEKQIPHFPFAPGMYFELIILCKAHQYNIAINGVHAIEYKHRFKQLGRISILEIRGDLRLLDVRSW